jgi:hypothetical protein
VTITGASWWDEDDFPALYYQRGAFLDGYVHFKVEGLTIPDSGNFLIQMWIK